LIDKRGIAPLSAICMVHEKICGSYVNYKLRLKNVDNYERSAISTSTTESDCAIVVQGPIYTKGDFTFETCRLYRKLYPNVKVIVSTWDDTAPSLIEKFKSIGVEVVLSKYFTPRGLGNVNYQIQTSRAGIQRAQELGIKYVMKIRSDMRISKQFALEYLISMLDKFPVSDSSNSLKGRIIANSAMLFDPFWVQDLLYFGYTDDIAKLFSIPFDSRDVKSSKDYLLNKYGTLTGKNMVDEEIAEVYITKRFLESFTEIQNTVESYWKCLKNYFLIVDTSSIDVIWVKYGFYFDNPHEFTGISNVKDPEKRMDFQTSVAMIDNRIPYYPWMEDLSSQNVWYWCK
jgi:hypothetical protein